MHGGWGTGTQVLVEVVVPVEVERVMAMGTVCGVIEVVMVPVEAERVRVVGVTTVHVVMEWRGGGGVSRSREGEGSGRHHRSCGDGVKRWWWCQLKWRVVAVGITTVCGVTEVVVPVEAKRVGVVGITTIHVVIKWRGGGGGGGCHHCSCGD